MSASDDAGSGAALELSHIDDHGHAVMVDVTNKLHTRRRAEARGRVVGIGDLRTRGDAGSEVLSMARAAGLFAAKRASSLIPLCHPLPLSALSVEFALTEDGVEICVVAETIGQTGVEMEALVGCSVAALSILDELADKAPMAVIEDVAVWGKSGGRSGAWRRREAVEVDER